MPKEPRLNSTGQVDVVIIGGAMMGSAAAWFLSHHPQFDGRIFVIERDPSYAFCSTSHTHSCMRQQYSNALNIEIAQFAAELVQNFKHFMEAPEAPDIALDSFGYMYLAENTVYADQLLRNKQLQVSLGVGTKILSLEDIARYYPFYNLDDIILGSLNQKDEGYFDGASIFSWWRNAAIQKGVVYLHDQVITLDCEKNKVIGVHLASGDILEPGLVVNAAGPRAFEVAAMAGIDLPVEPRRRYSFMFTAQTSIEHEIPLTIDQSGVHFLRQGSFYLAGCKPDKDVAVAPDDFEMDNTIWQDKVWPALAHRVPAFEAARVEREWVGHYAFNAFDANAVIGPHPDISNFYFMNGFSGHGLQQSPAMGRGIAEHIVSGAYQTLDLSPLSFDRILSKTPNPEIAII